MRRVLLCALSFVIALSMIPSVAFGEPANEVYGEEIDTPPSGLETASSQSAFELGEPLESDALEVLDQDDQISTLALSGPTARTISEIRSYYASHPFSQSTAVTYSSTPATSYPYAAGAMDETSLTNGLNALNVIRYIAGITGDVTLNTSYNEAAQAASVIMAANKKLTHTPEVPAGLTADDDLYKLGYAGASKSNIAFSYPPHDSAWALINGWMSDSDDGNIGVVGHRRWCLNTAMTQTGFGHAVSSNYCYQAMYSLTGQYTAQFTQVAWPAQAMPVELFASSDPWSISVNRSVLSAAGREGVEVTLKRSNDNTTWVFNSSTENAASGDRFYVSTTNTGDSGAIIFRPAGLTAINAGDTFEVTITGLSTGTITYTVEFFLLTPRDVANCSLSGLNTNYDYTGNEITPTLTVKDGTKTLVENVDYSLSYLDNKNAGTAAITITGMGSNYGGSITKTFTITPASLSGASFSSILSEVYSGNAYTPTPTVTLGGKTLVKDTDFSFSYSNNTNAGTSATVTVNGIGNYSGTASTTFIISPASLTSAEIGSISNQTYTGGALSPEPTVTLGGKTLVKDTDFSFSYSNNTTVGTSAKVTINGIGNYSGSTSKSFFISAADINSASIQEIPNQTFTGYTITPNPVITFGDKTLIKDTDYELSYLNNTDTGIATVTIAGKGNFTGTASKSFKIAGIPLDSVHFGSIPAVTYTGDPLTPTPTVTLGGKTLVENTDFTFSYSSNINVGTSAAVTVNGIGNYSGTASTTFTINPAALALADIGDILSQTYIGSALSPEPTVTMGEKTLVKDVDFSFSYSNNLNVGFETATVTITGIGNYTGTAHKTFSINAASITDTVIEDIPNQVFEGQTISPDPVITFGGVALKKDVDYTLSYLGNTRPGSATVYIAGKGNYTGTTSKTFTIEGERINGAVVSGIEEQYQYCHEAIEPTPTVTLNGKTLVKGIDYTITYANNIDANYQKSQLPNYIVQSMPAPKVIIRGIGDYSGMVEKEFGIYARQLTEWITVSGLEKSYPYTGSEICPEPLVTTSDGIVLQKDKDYSLRYLYNVELSHPGQRGYAQIYIEGRGNYYMHQSGCNGGYYIYGTTLEGLTVSGVESSYTFTGNPITPKPTVTLDGKTLVEGVDYSLSYRSNIYPGSTLVAVTIDGEVAASVPFEITDASMDDVTIGGLKTEYTCTGLEITPSLTLKHNGKTLSSNWYTLEYSNNVQPGTATVVVTGKYYYVGTRTLTFEITGEMPAVEKSMLMNLVDRAEALNGSRYSSSSWNAVTDALVAAKSIIANEDATQIEVNSAVAALDNALNNLSLIKSDWERLYGADRFATMSNIAKTGWTTSEYVIVASGASFPDALAASSLAGLRNAPMILTQPKSLSTEARNTISSLGASKVIIVGGPAVVSTSVENSLKAMSGIVEVKRLSGDDRFATALKIYGEGQGSWGNTAIIASGTSWPDALSVSPFSAAEAAPIFLSSPTTGLTAESIAAIKAGGFENIVLVGGSAVVPELVRNQLAPLGVKSITRLGGEHRYETSVLIAQYSLENSPEFTIDQILCTTGSNYPDALAGGAFGGRIGSVLLLVDDSKTGRFGIEQLIHTNAQNIGMGYVLGGTAMVPESLFNDLNNATK